MQTTDSFPSDPVITRRLLTFPVTAEDLALLYALYSTTRDRELSVVDWSQEQKTAFLTMQFNAQHQWYTTQYPGVQFFILSVGEEPIGRLYLHEWKGMMNIMDIALFPQWRNRGLGGRLIQEVIQDSTERGLTPYLHVEFFNPAKHLYDRLGFVETNFDGVNYRMEYRKPGTSST
jgi:GNAT superfamily N-acetyltransferase